MEDEWKLTAVNPSLSPVDFRLHCCKPGVSQDGLLVGEVGEEESEPHFLITGLHFQVCIVFNVSIFISGSVHIINWSWSM